MSKAQIFYHDIGDYLSRDEKLKIIKDFGSISNVPWTTLTPNKEADWINQRNEAFGEYIPLGNKKDKTVKTFFEPFYSNGLKTNRDAWCYNSSKSHLVSKIKGSIVFYNSQVESFSKQKSSNPDITAESFITLGSTQFSWDREQKKDVNLLKKYSYAPSSINISSYRPFCKQYVYFNRNLNNCVYQIPKLFPLPVSHTQNPESENLLICVSGVGVTKAFTTIITNVIPDVQLIGNSQCYPLYYYEKRTESKNSLLDEPSSGEGEYIRRDGISDYILNTAQNQYGDKAISKEDIFYYVYGYLHNPQYRTEFSNDLKKMLPRLPLVDGNDSFRNWSRIGRELAELHLNYETVEPWPDCTVTGADSGKFRVEKMRFPKKGQKDTIIFNSSITISGIPEKAYEYVVNGRSAIEWIMERYQVRVDKKSGIKNDPNDWCDEVRDERYILDLVLRIITVSVRTVGVLEG